MTLPGDGSGAFRYGGFRGSYNIVSNGLFRHKGQFVQTVSERMRQTNVALAADLQRQVAQALRQGLIRKGVSTGALLRTIEDARNRTPSGQTSGGFQGFAVGMIEFLNSQGPQGKSGESARVWEQIEKGTRVHVGQRIVGLWSDEIAATGLSYHRGDYTSQRNLVGEVFPMGPHSGQGFRPFSSYAARHALKKAKREGKFAARITNPIRAEEYFVRGWAQFGGLQHVKNEYQALFSQLGIRTRWSNGVLQRR